MQYDTHIYVCVGSGGRGREKGECKKLDLISNRESEILLSRIFILGGGKLRSDFDYLIYYVSCFDKQQGAAIFQKNMNINSEY